MYGGMKIGIIYMHLNIPPAHKFVREKRNARGTPVTRQRAVVPPANPRLFRASLICRESNNEPYPSVCSRFSTQMGDVNI
jgi:hypothetical protein